MSTRGARARLWVVVVVVVVVVPQYAPFRPRNGRAHFHRGGAAEKGCRSRPQLQSRLVRPIGPSRTGSFPSRKKTNSASSIGSVPHPAGSGTATASARCATSRARSELWSSAGSSSRDRTGTSPSRSRIIRWGSGPDMLLLWTRTSFNAGSKPSSRGTGSPRVHLVVHVQRCKIDQRAQRGWDRCLTGPHWTRRGAAAWSAGRGRTGFCRPPPEVCESSPATEGRPDWRASSGCAPPAECTTRPSATMEAMRAQLGGHGGARQAPGREVEQQQARQPSQLGGNRPRPTRIAQVELGQGDQGSELDENRPLPQGSLGKAMREGASTGPAQSGGSGTGSYVGTETRDCQAYQIRSGGVPVKLFSPTSTVCNRVSDRSSVGIGPESAFAWT
jgi:hypothetical protein